METIFGTDEAGNSPTPNTENNTDSEFVGQYRLRPLALSVFKRERNGKDYFSFTLQRAYTTDDGESFEHTNNLRPRDLRKAARLLKKAADDIQELSFNPAEN